MKVSETPNVVPAAAAKVASGAGNAREADERPVRDRVSVSPAQQRAALEAMQAAVSSGRAERLQEIIQAVKSGQLYPSPRQIAQQLVSEAEVEARLRAMLVR